MRKILPILMLSLSLLDGLPAQWIWQNPKPTGNDVHDIGFIDANTGLLVGDNGTVFKTRNGGDKWTTIQMNPGYNFSHVVIVDAAHIWLLGSGASNGEIQATVKILFSSDAGESWLERLTGSSLPDTLRVPFHDIHFLTPLLGWLVGDSGIVLQTTDGGSTWLEHTTVYDYSLQRVEFVGDSVGFICGGLFVPPVLPGPTTLSISKGAILRTTDAGANWDTIFSDTIEVDAVHFQDSVLGWALGTSIWIDMFGEGQYRWYVLKTTNGGLEWNVQRTIYLLDITFADDLHGWAVGAGGDMLTTSDGGNLWFYSNPTQRFISRLYRIQFSDVQHGYIVGSDGAILQSSDGGQTWTPYDSRPISWIDDIFFINPDTGWYAQSDLYRTTDGGDSWSPSGVSGIRRIFCYDGNHCWGCGYNGAIIFSSDAGNTWAQQNSGVTSELRAIKFVNPQIGWTGAGGTAILKTTDGGINWFTQATPTLGGLDKIVAQDAANIWLFGTLSIANTSDGGGAWVIDTGRVPIFFLNFDTGWAKSADTLLSTYDGGQTWQSLGQPWVSGYNTQFLTAELGWTSFTGTVSKTTDGGLSWKTELAVSVYNLLWHMYFSDSVHGWVVGNTGAMIRYGYPEKITSVNLNPESRELAYQLYQNYPNPFNATTTIKYSINNRAHIVIRIVDILGRDVRTLRNGIQDAGNYFLTWDGKDRSGFQMPSGVYLCVLDSEDLSSQTTGRRSIQQVRKLLLIK